MPPIALPSSITRLLASSALVVLAVWLLPTATAVAQRPRVIVLSFEGWRADTARRAVISGLETAYELVDEDGAVRAAAEIGVDVSTPDGMSAVVVHLGIELVVGGSVVGRNRGARTTVWVSDTNGNELATIEAPGPTARGGPAAIGEAARAACAQAYESLHPPEAAPPEVDDTPPMFTDEEEERADGSDREPTVDDPNRWRMPIFRALVGLDLRNRTAAIAPLVDTSRFDADIFPTIALQLESHPLAFLPGLENGVYVSVNMAFSAGLYYFNGIAPYDPYPMNTYLFEFNAGYAGVIANVFELGGTLGMGIDGFSLQQRDGMPTMGRRGDVEFPSTEYAYVRPAIFGRARLYQDLVHLELGFGGRIFFGTGQIGSNQGVWDDGFGSGGGIDLNLGLGGIVAPGFSYAARFGYSAAFVSLADGSRMSTGATDEAIHIHLMVGWAFVP